MATTLLLWATPPGAAAPQDVWPLHYFGPTRTIGAANQQSLAAAIEHANARGGTLVLDASLPRGPLPVRPNSNTRIVDHRYSGGINITRGNHPRLEGYWPQYSGLETGLARNFVISDVIAYDAQVESWKSEPKPPNPKNTNLAQDSHEYSNTHNHYQNLLSEVWGFSPTINAVALWGDAGAFYPGVKSWGGFLSARSWPVHWQEYVPPGTPEFADADFDAQLIGLEIDVLNGGLDHGSVSKTIGMPLSKSGLQIVGFGKRNSAAIEIRTEDSDDIKKSADERKGTWHYGIIAYNSLNSDSTFLFSETPKARTGLDLSKTEHSDAAIKIRSDGERTGLSINDTRGGQIYADDNRTVLRYGDRGFSLNAPGGREVIGVGRWGMVSWNGINLTPFAILFLLVNAWMLLTLLRQRRTIDTLGQRLDKAGL